MSKIALLTRTSAPVPVETAESTPEQQLEVFRQQLADREVERAALLAQLAAAPAPAPTRAAQPWEYVTMRMPPTGPYGHPTLVVELRGTMSRAEADAGVADALGTIREAMYTVRERFRAEHPLSLDLARQRERLADHVRQLAAAKAESEDGLRRAREALAAGDDPAPHEAAARKALEEIPILENRIPVLRQLVERAEAAAREALWQLLDRRRIEMHDKWRIKYYETITELSRHLGLLDQLRAGSAVASILAEMRRDEGNRTDVPALVAEYATV